MKYVMSRIFFKKILKFSATFIVVFSVAFSNIISFLPTIVRDAPFAQNFFIHEALAAAPVFQAAGTALSGTGAVSPLWPTHQVDDIALLFVESTGGQPVTLSTPAGFTAVTNSPQFTGAGTAGTRLTAYWARATSNTMPPPTVGDAGDHVVAQILTYRGVIKTGNPWDATTGGNKPTASSALSVLGVTTSLANTLVVVAASQDRDANSSATFSGWTNGNLSAVTERSDFGANPGNGGGFGVMDGIKITAGATGNTTATLSNSVVNAHMTVALKPQPTTTIGDGTNPASTTLTPGGSATMAGAFTFQTDTGVDTISSVVVNLGVGNSAGISLVEVTSDDGVTVYGSVVNPASDTPSITLAGLTATTASTQYKIRITPKSHTNMPAPPDVEYTVVAVVSSWVSPNTSAGVDTSGAVITIDNLSPSEVSNIAGIESPGQVQISWTNPVDADFQSVIILRNTVPVTDVPIEGSTYIVTDIIGASEVRCVEVNTSATCTDTGLADGITYYYKAFAKDTRGNYSPLGTDLMTGVVAPSFQAVGTAVSGTGAVTPVWPAHLADDVALLFVESSGGQAVTLTAPAGFAVVPNTPQSTSGGNLGTRLTVYWARATSAAMPNPTVGDPGNHVLAQILTYRGVVITGNPWDATAGNVKTTGSLVFSAPGVTTSITDTLIVNAISQDIDAVSSATFSGWTNANLMNIAERIDVGINAGIGGGFAVSDGVKSTAGATGNTTGSVINSTNAYSTIALKPQARTILANGTDPVNITIGPSGAATMADTFTFKTNFGTDSVTDITVDLGVGASSGISLVEITNNGGGTVYGSVANPASDTPVITITGLTANTTLTNYKIRITPKTHANMPVPPGGLFAVNARVASWTSTNLSGGADTAGTTVTIDNLSPGDVTNFTVNRIPAQATITWTNPADTDLHSVIILRDTVSVTDTPTEGTTYTVGAAIGTSVVRCVVLSPTATCVDTGLNAGTTYYYKAFAKDTYGNYSRPSAKSILGNVISPVFDTGVVNGATFDSIMWKGALGVGNSGKVKFQFAASDCANGATNAPTCNAGTWSYYGGDTCGSFDWFDPLQSDTPVELRGLGLSAPLCHAAWNNKRYFRYKVQLCSDDCLVAGIDTPVVSDVIISWAP